MPEEQNESLIKKKKVVGEADIFNEIITGQKHKEEDIYEEETLEEAAEDGKEGKPEEAGDKPKAKKADDAKAEDDEDLGEALEEAIEDEDNEGKEEAEDETEEAEEKAGKKKPAGIEEVKKEPEAGEEGAKAEALKDELPKKKKKSESLKKEAPLSVKLDTLEEADAKEKEEKIKKEDIKKILIDKAQQAVEADDSPHTTIKLKFLEDEEKHNVFIGTKRGIFNKYKYDGALFLGRVNEEEQKNKNIFLDSKNPHVVFVCGARGSGKSYVLGVIAEELALNNKDVGVIVIDPIGVFWSMRFPNKEEKELKRLEEFGLKPKGLSNLKVFVPEGIMKSIPKSTYDAGFAMQPSLLTTDDWCLTFGIERFGPTGLLLDKALKKLEMGYKQMDTTEEAAEEPEEDDEKKKVAKKPKKLMGKKIPGKGKEYSLDDLIDCMENDEELNSRDKGYKQDSIRALVSRFESAKYWGIFSKEGTPLSELSREGQLTILDTSFLEDNVTALVIGILARRVLAARKISTRKEAATQFKTKDVKELLELEIPPTWMVIDEAHTLVPSGNESTPASNSIVEYVKQGRRPGCSLAIATQQPSAINTKVLSQLDVMISHKLIFDDDIKAIYKRMPTIVPMAYKRSNFIKTLPVGVALTGDRQEETSRAFIMGIRPRMSQHEGRDAETGAHLQKMSNEEVENLCYESALKEYEKEKKIDRGKIEKLVETLNVRYKTDASADKIIKRLKEKGAQIEGKAKEEPDEKNEGDNENEEKQDSESPETEEIEGLAEDAKGEKTGEKTAISTELIALPKRIDENKARDIANRIRKKKTLGFFGSEERISSLLLKYNAIWRVSYDVFETQNEFVSRKCFINSINGEFIHFKNGKFTESKGMREIYTLTEDEVAILKELQKKESTTAELINKGFPEPKVLKTINKLSEIGMINMAVDKNSGTKMYWLKDGVQLPPSEKAKLLSSLAELPRERMEALPMEKESFGKEEIILSLKKLWPKIVIKKVDEVYRPVWEITFDMDAKKRKAIIDAINGELIS